MTAVVASYTWNESSGSNANVTAVVPSGTASGDLLIAFPISDDTSTLSTAGSGFTQVNGQQIGGNSDESLYVYTKTAGGSESNTTWTLSTARNWGVLLLRVTGHNGRDVSATGSGSAANSTSQPVPAVTTTVNDCLLISVIASDQSAVTPPTLTAPSGYTEVLDTEQAGANMVVGFATGVQTTAGTTSAVNWTIGASDRAALATVAVKPTAGLGATLVVATETDAVVAVGRQKFKTLVVDTETDAAQVLGRRKVKALATVTETDTAEVITRATPALGVALETDTTVTIGRRKVKALATVTETDATVTLVPSHRRALTVATETDATLVFGKRKSKLLAIANETDLALNLQAINLGIANETDSAVVIGRRKRKTVPLVTETDAVVALTRRKRRTLAPGVETDAVVVLGRRKRKAIATVIEVDEARVIQEAVYTFTPPSYQKPYKHPWPTGPGGGGIYKGKRFHLDQAVSIVRMGGVLRAVRSPAPEQLTAAGVEGEDWFIGGHIYQVKAGVLAELQAGGFV